MDFSTTDVPSLPGAPKSGPDDCGRRPRGDPPRDCVRVYPSLGRPDRSVLVVYDRDGTDAIRCEVESETIDADFAEMLLDRVRRLHGPLLRVMA